MADDSHATSPPVPTAIHLQEPKFPDHNEETTQPSPALQPSSSDTVVASNNSRTMELSPNGLNGLKQTSTPRLSRRGSADSAPSRPSMQKSATERPQPTATASFSRPRRAGTLGDMPQLEPQATLTFDPYSSDSTSSDSDEPLSPPGLDGGKSEPQEAQTGHTRRRSHAGPFSRFKLANEHFNTKGKVCKADGRLKLSIHETVNSGYFAKTLGAGLRKHFKSADDLESLKGSEKEDVDVEKISPEDDCMEDPARRVRLNIVVIVIGSRGDIQPFLRIGKILKEDYGHRVRIATHPAFKEFVEKDSGLEFFSIGGDPSELMAFMVKNPGLIPNLETVREGEIGRRRAAMYEMFQGMWRACTNSTDDESDQANLKSLGDRHPFVCDAIIANPPSFAPPHIAERLGVPLHMMFTFPYSPTVQFPHPLANIKASNVDAKYTNFMSYPLVELMTWQGLGDLINRFRSKTLRLEEVSTLWAPGQLYRLKVPYTYMWSPGLVPKPQDWGSEIDVSGFVFLDLASSFDPPGDLVKFLEAGPPPVYIGFGSIVVDDPDEFTKLIFKAVELAGVRALVSKGWGGFGSNESAPENVFMLENTPHDWLFPKVSAVVHHGGAGTTAIGLKCGKPTMIVPFFGDQPFWGVMVAKAGAGAHECIPYKKLNAERLAEGIKQCLTDEARENVQKIADSIAKEGDGALNAVRSFHRSLPLQEGGAMRCSLLPNQTAVWKLKNTSIRLSPLAAELLVEWRKIKWNELRLLRVYEWNDFGGPGEPVTGGWGVIVGTMSDVATGVGLVPVKMARSVKEREKYYEKKYKVKKRERSRKKTLEKANKEFSNGNIPNGKPVNGSIHHQQQNGRPPAAFRQESTLSKLTEPEDWLAQELAQEAGHGVKKTFSAIVKSPMNFTVAITQGFHNAPRLYGDETVRRPHRITGFHSGVRAGRDEFVYGIRDGVTGLWMQPYQGAKESGALGFVRGFGFGIGGLVLKDIAAFLGPPAYFMKGLDEEHLKKYQPTNFLRRARIIQGRNEVQALSAPVNPDPTDEDGAQRTEHEKYVKRQLSEKWQALQLQITQETKRRKSGFRAALLGHSKHKEGTRIPLKSSRPGTPRPEEEETSLEQLRPKKAASAPIQQAAQVEAPPQPKAPEGHRENEDAEGGEEALLNGSIGAGGMGRTGTAPVEATNTQWKEKGAKKQKYRFSGGKGKEERARAREDAVGKRRVPNLWQASLQGNDRVVETIGDGGEGKGDGMGEREGEGKKVV